MKTYNAVLVTKDSKEGLQYGKDKILFPERNERYLIDNTLTYNVTLPASGIKIVDENNANIDGYIDTGSAKWLVDSEGAHYLSLKYKIVEDNTTAKEQDTNAS